MSLQALKARWQEYFDKVVAIGKPFEAMSNDDLGTCLEYAFRQHELLEAQRDEITFQIGFSAFAIADMERRLAGHNESAAIFTLCRCEWCVNGWTPVKGRT